MRVAVGKLPSSTKSLLYIRLYVYKDIYVAWLTVKDLIAHVTKITSHQSPLVFNMLHKERIKKTDNFELIEHLKECKNYNLTDLCIPQALAAPCTCCWLYEKLKGS